MGHPHAGLGLSIPRPRCHLAYASAISRAIALRPFKLLLLACLCASALAMTAAVASDSTEHNFIYLPDSEEGQLCKAQVAARRYLTDGEAEQLAGRVGSPCPPLLWTYTGTGGRGAPAETTAHQPHPHRPPCGDVGDATVHLAAGTSTRQKDLGRM